MSAAALVFVVTTIFAPFGALPDPGCWVQNPTGDRLEFTDSLWLWVYDPAGDEPAGYEYEGCSYGLDTESGDHTLTCEDAGINAPVTGTIETGLLIDGQRWIARCPDMGL